MRVFLKFLLWIAVGLAVSNTLFHSVLFPYWISGAFLYLVILGFAGHTDYLENEVKRLKIFQKSEEKKWKEFNESVR